MNLQHYTMMKQAKREEREAIVAKLEKLLTWKKGEARRVLEEAVRVITMEEDL